MVETVKEWLDGFSPVMQAFLATCFTWFVTGLGAALVFFFKRISQKVLDVMLGFAAGVMTAASFWSLLNPAVSMAEDMNVPPYIPVVTGFVSGAFSIWLLNKVLPHMHAGLRKQEIEGTPSSLKRSILLILAITIHNIPEGLAVGIAFGAVAANLPSASIEGAIALSIGIGLQNFPEGTSVSIPLRREGFTMIKSFWYGQLSGIVEPVAGVLGALAVMTMRPILPYALAYAAGAMMFVVYEELVPESHAKMNKDHATLGAIGGFSVMMLLDVSLG